MANRGGAESQIEGAPKDHKCQSFFARQGFLEVEGATSTPCLWVLETLAMMLVLDP